MVFVDPFTTALLVGLCRRRLRNHDLQDSLRIIGIGKLTRPFSFHLSQTSGVQVTQSHLPVLLPTVPQVAYNLRVITTGSGLSRTWHRQTTHCNQHHHLGVGAKWVGDTRLVRS